MEPGRHLEIADDATAISEKVIGLLGNPERRAALAAEGHRLVRDRYDWKQLADRLDGIWRECAARSQGSTAVEGVRSV